MLQSRNMSPYIMYELKDRLTKAGFIHEKFEKVPLKVNDHDKMGQLGWYNLQSRIFLKYLIYFFSIGRITVKLCLTFDL